MTQHQLLYIHTHIYNAGMFHRKNLYDLRVFQIAHKHSFVLVCCLPIAIVCGVNSFELDAFQDLDSRNSAFSSKARDG